MDLVSVVIITLNRRQDLAECLRSLIAQDYKTVEIIVVDNGSSDGTEELLKASFRDVRVIRNESNLGGCIARNQGVTASSGEFVWFLDSDTVVLDPTLLTSLVSCMRSHHDVGVVGGEGVLDRDHRLVGVKRLTLLGNFMTRGEVLHDCPAGSLVDSDVIVTANFFARASLLRSLRGLDPYYFFFGEDLDLTWSIRKQGFRTVVFCNAPLLHKFSPAGRLSGHRPFPPRYFRNRNYFCWKHMGWRKLLALPFLDTAFIMDPRNLARASSFLKAKSEFGQEAPIRAAGDEAVSSRRLLARALDVLTRFPRLLAYGWWLVSGMVSGYAWFGLDFVRGRLSSGADEVVMPPAESTGER